MDTSNKDGKRDEGYVAKAFFNHSESCVFEVDSTGRIYGCNSSAREVFSVRRDNHPNIKEIAALGYRAKLDSFLRETFSRGEKVEAELLLRPFNGEQNWFKCSALKLDSETILIWVNDIRWQRSLENVLDEFPGFVFVKDEDLRFRYANRKLLQAFGCKNMSEILGKTDRDLNRHAAEVEFFNKFDLQVLKVGKLIIPSERFTQNDSQKEWKLTTSKLLNKKSVLGTPCIVGYSYDVEELENWSSDAEEYLARLGIEGTKVRGVAIADSIAKKFEREYIQRGGRFQGVYVLQHLPKNKQFQLLAARPRNSWPKKMGALVEDDQGVVGHILTTKKPFASTDCAKDNVFPLVDWSAVVGVPIIVRSGDDEVFWGVVCICSRDRNLEEFHTWKLRQVLVQYAEEVAYALQISMVLEQQANRVAALDHIKSYVVAAHDLNKELNGATECLRRLIMMPPQEWNLSDVKQVLESVYRSTDEAAKWTDLCYEFGRYLRNLANSETDATSVYRANCTFSEIDVNAVVLESLVAHAHKVRKHRIRVEQNLGELPPVVGHKTLIYHAVSNALDNAIVWGATNPTTGKTRPDFSITLETKFCEKNNSVNIIINNGGYQVASNTASAMNRVFEFRESDPSSLLESRLGFGTVIIAFTCRAHLGKVKIYQRLKTTVLKIELPVES